MLTLFKHVYTDELQITFLPLRPHKWPSTRHYYVTCVGLDWLLLCQHSVKIGQNTTKLQYQIIIALTSSTLHRVEVFIKCYQQRVYVADIIIFMCLYQQHTRFVDNTSMRCSVYQYVHPIIVFLRCLNHPLLYFVRF